VPKELEINVLNTPLKKTATTLFLCGFLIASSIIGTTNSNAAESTTTSINNLNGGSDEHVYGERDRAFRLPADIHYGDSHTYPRVEDMDASTGLRKNASGVVKSATSTLKYGSFTPNGIQTVIEGTPRVYLVFLGSEWGTMTPASAPGSTPTFSNDPKGVAPYLYKFLSGLGTGGETWSNVLTQYCDSSGTVKVANNATSCPAGAVTTGLPAATGALAGYWYDNSAPTSFTGTDTTLLGNEALAAANHFGNTTVDSNRNSQYVIVSPTGTHPDGFNTAAANFCAWHDAVQSPSTAGLVAFTNLPYLTDAGASCGQNYVNKTNGLLDGISIVEGHEYAETLSDMAPGAGWYNLTYGENGDICAWSAGPSGNINTSTGTFAMQSTWSNLTNSCALSAAAPTPPSPPALVNAGPLPGGATKVAYSYTFSATGSPAPTFTLTGALPAGIKFTSTTGVLSGTPTVAGSYSLTLSASNSQGTTAPVSLTLSIAGAPTFTAQSPSLTATVGTTYTNYQYVATGYPQPTFSISSGSLPTGLNLSSSGLLSGTPTAYGSFTFVVAASNGSTTLATSKTIVVKPAVPTVSSIVESGTVTSSATVQLLGTNLSGVTSIAIKSGNSTKATIASTSFTSISLTSITLAITSAQNLVANTSYTFVLTYAGSTTTVSSTKTLA
jgi:serine protease